MGSDLNAAQVGSLDLKESYQIQYTAIICNHGRWALDTCLMQQHFLELSQGKTESNTQACAMCIMCNDVVGAGAEE